MAKRKQQKHKTLQQDTFNKTINKLLFSLDEERKRENKEEVFCLPWKQYLIIFIILNLFFAIFDPAGKNCYSPYFIFIFSVLSILGWEDWKIIQKESKRKKAKHERLRQEKISRIKKNIKEEFQREQENLTKRIRKWKVEKRRKEMAELQRRVAVEEQRRYQARVNRRQILNNVDVLLQVIRQSGLYH